MSTPYNEMRKVETKFRNMLNGEYNFELIVWLTLCKHPVCLWLKNDPKDRLKPIISIKLYKDRGYDFELIKEYSSLEEFKLKRKELF